MDLLAHPAGAILATLYAAAHPDRVSRLVLVTPGRVGYFDGVELDPAAVAAALGKLSGPTLLYAGDADPLVTPAMVRTAAPLFREASVIIQPGAGHFPWVEHPAAFAAAVNAFLA